MTIKNRHSSPGSIYTISDSEENEAESDFAISEASSSDVKLGTKRKRLSTTSNPRGKSGNAKKTQARSNEVKDEVNDIEDLPLQGPSIRRIHSKDYHDVNEIVKLQSDLLDWFEDVRDKRGMPWRKKYNPNLTDDEKGQRAYEIWVSEVMLQQTQVATVIAYWQRWITQWPTISDLSQADIEAVNSAWKGLGYYRRARSLLAGAKTVMGDKKYKGRLPSDPGVMEKEIDGVGRYTAGAISSMAYGIRTPIVDGNIHRLLTRLLALHASQTSPQTIKFLWNAAEELVNSLPEKKGVAGDWNQALMELGSQICKPVSPNCSACPLRSGCKAYAETSAPPPCSEIGHSECTLCEPIPSNEEVNLIPSVMVFPMRKEKKVSRSEEEVVCIVEWKGEVGRRWLFVKRPDKGLLAGLFEPLTTPITSSSTKSQRLDTSLASLAGITDMTISQLKSISTSHIEIGSIPHIFSHINMTYHIQVLSLNPPEGGGLPMLGGNNRAIWLTDEEVEKANVGTGVKKVWKEVFGNWGVFERGRLMAPMSKSKSTSKVKLSNKSKIKSGIIKDTDNGGKVVKKIMMPLMPRKGGTAEV